MKLIQLIAVIAIFSQNCLTQEKADVNFERTKQYIIHYEKPHLIYKEQPYSKYRRYYRPYYTKSRSRFCDPYWRKPFKSISFGFDI